MKQKEQMSIGTDKKIEVPTSYLLSFNAFKKITKTLLLIFMLLFLNIGSKYPALSETNIKETENIEMEIKAEYEKYVKMYQDIYQQSTIQQIEFESEIVIPNYIDFKDVEYTYKTAQELSIPPRVAFRLMFKESSFIDTVKSSAGAEGLMQLMPGTREKYYNLLRLDTLNLSKNHEDIYIGLYYLKDLKQFWLDRGNSEKIVLTLSIASYNAGENKVIIHKGIPPYKETQDFVKFILKPHSNPQFYANIIKKNSPKFTT